MQPDTSVGGQLGNVAEEEVAESPTLRIVALETERERDSWRKAHEADTTLSWIVKAKTGNNSRPEWTTMRAAAPVIKQHWLL